MGSSRRIERCIAGATVEIASIDEAFDDHGIGIELGDAPSGRCTLVVARGSQPFCADALDLLALLAPHPRNALRESRIRGVLTPRECEVLRLVGEDLTNRQVARRLGIAPGTVRSHLEHTYSKLDVGTRTAAIAAAG